MKWITVSLPVLVTLTACVQVTRRSVQEGSTLPPEFAQLLTQYESAWQAKDAARLAELFDENGFVLPNGSPPRQGRDAIREHYAGQGGPLALCAIAWARDGSIGYIIGAYTDERGRNDIGKFTLTLVRGPDAHW